MNLNVSKKVVSLIMLITMLMVSTASFAIPPATDNIQWTYIYSIGNYLENDSILLLKRLNVFADTEVYGDRHAGIFVQLQKLESDGTTWSDVSGKTWASYPSSDYAYVNEEHVVVSSGTYRCYLVHSAFTTGGLLMEYVEAYTNTVTV